MDNLEIFGWIEKVPWNLETKNFNEFIEMKRNERS